MPNAVAMGASVQVRTLGCQAGVPSAYFQVKHYSISVGMQATEGKLPAGSTKSSSANKEQVTLVINTTRKLSV